MSGWAAANDPIEKDHLETAADGTTKFDASLNENNSKGKRAETTEAALARLTHAYTTAMKCVGALHRLSAMMDKMHSNTPDPQSKKLDSNNQNNCHNDNDEDSKNDVAELSNQIIRVAQAARFALQDTVLLDPLIAIYAPSFHHAHYHPLSSTISSTNIQNKDDFQNPRNDNHLYFCPQRDCKHSDSFILASTSMAHRSSLKELAYLSLTNYADLLICCCTTTITNINTTNPKSNITILNRGILSTLPGIKMALSQSKSSCWEKEAIQTTRQLVVMSYFDASELNLRSDPTLWLKLACAARAFGNEIISCLHHSNQKDPIPNDTNQHVDGIINMDIETNMDMDMNKENDGQASSILAQNKSFALDPHIYHPHLLRLERYALEKGLSVLPNGIPPNRTLQRAWKEWNQEYDKRSNQIYDSSLLSYHSQSFHDKNELSIDLTRYSWSTLGRNLMRACREGNAYVSIPSAQNNLINRPSKKRRYTHTSFGSPTVLLQISPMLTLPPTALGTICEYLGSGYGNPSDQEHDSNSKETWKLHQDVKKFESTCRALSVEVISARTRLEEEKHHRRLQEQHTIIEQNLEQEIKLEEEQRKALSMSTKKSDGMGTPPVEIEKTMENDSSTKKNHESSSRIRSSRVSKRVQSQLLTSGKEAERSAKRNSIEYCLLRNILSCSASDSIYITTCNTSIEWSSIPSLSQGTLHLKSLSTSKDVMQHSIEGSSLHKRNLAKSIEATARGGRSSLHSFMERWSGCNSGPFDLLWQFLVHVSLHVEDVFASETGGSMMLSSCFMDCFEMLSKKSGNISAPMFGSFDNNINQNYDPKSVEDFAVNLLISELRMRRCERLSLVSDSFDSDVSTVSYMIPNLLQFADSLSALETTIDNELLSKLQSRTYWLACVYYLWFSRKTKRPSDASMAESLALQYLDVTIESLSQLPSKKSKHSIRTPHLESLGRDGDHWKELNEITLTSYKDSLQAMLVVTHARLRFSKLQSRLRDIKYSQEGITPSIPENEKERPKKEKDLSSSSDISLGGTLYIEEELKVIGKDLLKRYSVTDHVGNHHELISDFLSSYEMMEYCGKENTSPNNDLERRETWKDLWDVIPNFSSVERNKFDPNSNQSLLSILAFCLNSHSGNGPTFLRLLGRLIITAFDERRKYLDETKSSQSYSDNSLLDDDSDFSDDHSDDDDGKPRKYGKASREESYLACIKFFLDKFAEIAYVLHKEGGTAFNEVMKIIKSPDIHSIIQASVHESSKHIDLLPNDESKSHLSARFENNSDLESNSPRTSLLITSYSFVNSLCNICKDDHLWLESIYFTSLVRLLIQYRKVFVTLLRKKSDKRQSRFDRQKACFAEANCVGVISSLLANMLSSNLPLMSNHGILEPSPLIFSISSLGVSKGTNVNKENKVKHFVFEDSAPLTQFISSLLWFWKYLEKSNAVGKSHGGNFTVNSIDRGVAKLLAMPIGSVIIATCGACMGLTESEKDDTDQNSPSDALPFTEFYDSDESVNDCFSEDENTENLERKDDMIVKIAKYQKGLLHSLYQTVHCVSLIFEGVDEKQSCDLSSFSISGIRKPLLPLVVVRVLCHFSDILITEFHEEIRDSMMNDKQNYVKKKGQLIWTQVYPYGTRTIGDQLDGLLHKAYKFLHGFTLVTNQQQQSLTTDSLNSHMYLPESITAAAQLYRCIKRTYFNSKRLPPRSALETVAAVLPSAPESHASKQIRNFLFSNPITLAATFELDINFGEEKHEEELPSFLQEQIRSSLSTSFSPTENNSIHDPETNVEYDIFILRKGLTHELARGPLPKIGNVEDGDLVGMNNDGDIRERNGYPNDRNDLSLYERSVWKKFDCILNDLCYSPVNPVGWANAALCLWSKANLICDRISSPSSSYRKEDFLISPLGENFEKIRKATKAREEPSLLFDDMIKIQEKECQELNETWLPCLGNDLSAYIRHSFASFSSLLECACEISENIIDPNSNQSDEEKFIKFDHIVMNMYLTKKFSSWQLAWGGMFVQALRVIAKRCLRLSFAVAIEQESRLDSNREDDDNEQIVPEIAKTIATNFYAELQGGMLYGLPIQQIPKLIKRKLAQNALQEFKGTIENLRDDESELWPYHFMIGKCYEKIAGTYSMQRYSSDNESGERNENNTIRLYERHMAKSLNSYAFALKQSEELENEGRIVDQQGGGSSGGPTEAFYRLHASRLKILILAVRRNTNERLLAEMEAIRLISKYERHESSEVDKNKSDSPPSEASDVKNVRDRIWELFGELVTAMAQCRVKDSFFHRSVYRHAQSLLIAPMVNDPNDLEIYRMGSLMSLPVTRAYHLRGLSTDSCANAAASIMASLFDKKRAHICAVWVTTPSKPSPFEVLNDSVRKYDRLRLKYVGAYIDCMNLCNRIDALETFMSWTSSCRRDLSSLYNESAKVCGRSPRMHHSKDNMLEGYGLIWYAKRYANDAISCIIIKKVKEMKKQNLTEKSDEAGDNPSKFLKMAYTCFVRLRFQLDDGNWKQLFPMKTKNPGVEALLSSYLYYNRIRNENFAEIKVKRGQRRIQRYEQLKLAISDCTKKFVTPKSRNKKRKDQTNEKKDNETTAVA